MPSTFFAPSNPRGPGTGVDLTEEESTTAAVGSLSRSSWVRSCSRRTASTFSQSRLFVHRVKCLWVADHVTVKSCGSERQGMPVVTMNSSALTYSRQRCSQHVRPPRSWIGMTSAAMRAHAVSVRSDG